MRKVPVSFSKELTNSSSSLCNKNSPKIVGFLKEKKYKAAHKNLLEPAFPLLET